MYLTARTSPSPTIPFVLGHLHYEAEQHAHGMVHQHFSTGLKPHGLTGDVDVLFEVIAAWQFPTTRDHRGPARNRAPRAPDGCDIPLEYCQKKPIKHDQLK